MSPKKNEKEVQIGRRSIRIWYDNKEVKRWKVSVIEWNLDHWDMITEAEALKEKDIRFFYHQEVVTARRLLNRRELPKEKDTDEKVV